MNRHDLLVPPGSPSVASQALMTGSVTKATPIQFTDSKIGTKKQRGRKTALPCYYACLSCDLLLMASGADTHTYTPTFVDETISRNQAHEAFGRAPGLTRC